MVELLREHVEGLGRGDAREEEVQPDGEHQGGGLELGGGLGDVCGCLSVGWRVCIVSGTDLSIIIMYRDPRVTHRVDAAQALHRLVVRQHVRGEDGDVRLVGEQTWVALWCC